MRKSTAFVTILILGLSVLGATDAPASESTYVEDQVLVDFQPGTSDPVIDGINGWLGASVQARFRLAPGLRLVQLPEGSSVEAAVSHYRAQPEVIYAGPNWLAQTQGEPVIPHDPLFFFDKLWGLHNTGQDGGTEGFDIDGPEAWSDPPPLTTVVGIIDQNVDIDHEDLQANLWVNRVELGGRTGVDDDGNGYIDDLHGWDFVNNDNTPGEDDNNQLNEHGTHVAGTVAAVHNNLLGVVGVNSQARIMALRACDVIMGCPQSRIIAALDYATENGAQVTNLSIGWDCDVGGTGWYPDDPVAGALSRAHQAGVLVVAAAGNQGRRIEYDPFCPASYPHENVIAVTAMDRKGKLWSSSNYGVTSVDLGAPGVWIFSTLMDDDYGEADGTSMATPHVVGAASYLLGFPILRADRHLYVKQLLLETVVDNDEFRQTVSGGVLNLRNALDRLLAENP